MEGIAPSAHYLVAEWSSLWSGCFMRVASPFILGEEKPPIDRGTTNLQVQSRFERHSDTCRILSLRTASPAYIYQGLCAWFTEVQHCIKRSKLRVEQGFQSCYRKPVKYWLSEKNYQGLRAND